MNIETIFSCVSFVIVLVNSLAVIGIYMQYIRKITTVFCAIRSDKSGEIEICDPLAQIP